jgi:hypothetical protein
MFYQEKSGNPGRNASGKNESKLNEAATANKYEGNADVRRCSRRAETVTPRNSTPMFFQPDANQN